MAGLSEDTGADKLFRFALGVLLGAALTFPVAMPASLNDREHVAATLAVGFVTGVAFVAFGNGFIERYIKGRWW